MTTTASRRVPLLVLALLVSLTRTGLPQAREPATAPSTAPAADDRPLLLVHYMPWFESKPVSGVWGWHWTMNKFDPEKVGPDGRRQIASHYYPLTGPYDSADPHVLEYHALLMRIAGIDGVIADWYGIDGIFDYPVIHRRTQLLFDEARRRGLRFAVCYEDRVLKVAQERRQATTRQAMDRGQAHVRYVAEQWFRDPLYARWDGRPLLLVFGQEYLSRAEHWAHVFEPLGGRDAWPALFAQRPIAGITAGTFAWPPMWKSEGGVLKRDALDAYLDDVYARGPATIGAAFPGFHDIYAEAGAQPTHGRLDDADGDTLRHTLSRAVAAKVPLIQLVTWNDFGEGTMLEPTREHGYRSLEIIQQARRTTDPTFRFTPDDLRLPLRIYEMRKRASTKLDDAAEALAGGDSAKARSLLEAP
jgi:hypothetical protein